MIELPETYVLARQINETLVGNVIRNVRANEHPHAFAGYRGDPSEYHYKLQGKRITGASPGTGYTCGGNTEVECEDMLLVVSTPVKYHAPGAKLPAKHQLLIEFEDGSHMSCTVQMWGGMLCYAKDEFGIAEGHTARKDPSPISDEFDEEYFEKLLEGVKQSISAKAFLATEQRIPGLGNGVLQDILFNAQIHPKLKLESMSKDEKTSMFRSVKDTLREMAEQGGRDTEKDLYGHSGGYKTKLSNKTITKPCQVCQDVIIRQAYLGGNIYFCPTCQRLE